MRLPVPISDIVQPLRAALDPLAIYVFGSYARGEAHEHSDVDLLVVCPDPLERRGAAIKALVALAGLSMPKDVVVTSPLRIVEASHMVDSVVNEALAEGICVYENKRVPHDG